MNCHECGSKIESKDEPLGMEEWIVGIFVFSFVYLCMRVWGWLFPSPIRFSPVPPGGLVLVLVLVSISGVIMEWCRSRGLW